jgi:hypothetical protein
VTASRTGLATRGTAAPTAWRAAVPLLDPTAQFEVRVEDGVIASVEQIGERVAGGLELWPGYVEPHAHLALPVNFDDTLDDPRIAALSYLYHGVSHVVDLFGFPLVEELWEAGRAESALPYPELVHCGYAVTAMRDNAGRTGHGVEFPAPVHMLAVPGDLAGALAANTARGARFLKVMYTDGTEPGADPKFSRISERVLREVAEVTRARGVPAVLDCNTREEVLAAHDLGFRLFAHSVRDHELSTADWDRLAGARFVSTLSGLRPMVMEPDEFTREYGRPGFADTQDLANLEFVSGLTEPFGIRFEVQESRTAALDNMRRNSLAALERGALLVGTDCGNTGAFHGYSLLGELDLLAGDAFTDPALATGLRRAATVDGLRFFHDLTGEPAPDQPIAVGRPATFNLLPAAGSAPLSTLPAATVVGGAVIDRQAVARTIRALRSTDTKGKVAL